MTTFGHCALGTLAAAGVEAVEFWCLTPRCHNRHAVPIVPLIRSVGADASLVMIARRARCRHCGRLGCHVQPAAPPAHGTPDYRTWRRAELERLKARLADLIAEG